MYLSVMYMYIYACVGLCTCIFLRVRMVVYVCMCVRVCANVCVRVLRRDGGADGSEMYQHGELLMQIRSQMPRRFAQID